MAAASSRLHTLLRTCNRCAEISSGSALFLCRQGREVYKLRPPLLCRHLSVAKRTICHHCRSHHHTLLPWQQNFLKSCAVQSYVTQHRYSSHINSSTAKPSVQDPYQLVEKEMSTLCESIRQELCINRGDLGTIARYYFDGTGKAFRPMVVLLMAKACNFHQRAQTLVLESQRKIAMITEMLHTATLIHDDVIDASDTRRGKDSVNSVWGQRKAILTGDYILSMLSVVLARIGNPEVVSIMSQVVEDLIRGEFMQLGSKEDENERFRHYLDKTFKKTASMLAASCKSVSVLGDCAEEMSDVAYQYGKNLGISFQLVDDLLDFVSSEQQLGKPTTADLRLGLATAPVLFAAQQYPELNPLIMRRFSEDGDVETARYLVSKSDGIEQTKMLALEHTKEAIRQLLKLSPSDSQQALVYLTNELLQRKK